MFVPSLSWYNDHFYIEMAQKVAFFAPMDAVVRDASVADLREKNSVLF